MTNELENIRILVCGAASVGKTSLINLLINEEFIEKNKPISQDYPGCSKKAFQEYSCTKFGKKFIFSDIIGFKKTDKTQLWHSAAQYHLKKFCSYINDGFNLVIHVQKKQSISETDQVNYELVVKENFQDQVKSLCVINFADEEIDLASYWPTHRNSLIGRGFTYDDGVAVCCGHVRNPDYDAILKNNRLVSYNLLWESILRLTHNSQKIRPSFSMLKTITYDFLLYFTENILTRYFDWTTYLNNLVFCKSPSFNYETNETNLATSEPHDSFVHVHADCLMANEKYDTAQVNKIYKLLVIGYKIESNNVFIETLFAGKNMAKSLKQDQEYEYSREGDSYLIVNISYDELSKNELAFENRFLKCSHSSMSSINVCIVLNKFDSSPESNGILDKVYKYFDLKSKIIVVIDESSADSNVHPDNLKENHLNEKFFHVDTFIRSEKLNDIEKGISTYTIVYKEKFWNSIDSMKENKPINSLIDQNLLIDSQTDI